MTTALIINHLRIGSGLAVTIQVAHATLTNVWIAGISADIGTVMPAALAFGMYRRTRFHSNIFKIRKPKRALLCSERVFHEDEFFISRSRSLHSLLNEASECSVVLDVIMTNLRSSPICCNIWKV